MIEYLCTGIKQFASYYIHVCIFMQNTIFYMNILYHSTLISNVLYDSVFIYI